MNHDEGRAVTGGALFGLGMPGFIGWAATIPILPRLARGMWLDQVAPSDMSWTSAMLLAGLVCANARAVGASGDAS